MTGIMISEHEYFQNGCKFIRAQNELPNLDPSHYH